MKIPTYIYVLIAALALAADAFAQGPPIRTDKPIMLGAKKATLRSFVFYEENAHGSFTALPIMFDYTPSNRWEVSAMLPLILSDEVGKTPRLADVNLGVKYQFYRRDQTGKTLRFVAKLRENIPIAEANALHGMSPQNWQTTLGLAGGIESTRYGLQSEIGYEIQHGTSQSDALLYKLGFGLPLLKSVYPVKQINLFFEYEGLRLSDSGDHALYYAQGVQFAYRTWTFDASLQYPLVQSVPHDLQRNFNFLLGARVILF